MKAADPKPLPVSRSCELTSRALTTWVCQQSIITTGESLVIVASTSVWFPSLSTRSWITIGGCWRSFASVPRPLGTLTFNWDDPLPSAENPADKRLSVERRSNDSASQHARQRSLLSRSRSCHKSAFWRTTASPRKQRDLSQCQHNSA